MCTRQMLVGAGVVVTVAGALAQPATPHRFEFHEDHMGTRFRIVLYAADDAAARGASRAAFSRIAELDSIMSDYKQDSELMRLNRSAGGPSVAVSPDLWRVLHQAQDFARLTDGAFDPTVGPVVRLWRRARKLRELPEPQRLAEARALVGFRFLHLDDGAHTARLDKAGMQLDLGGIAKGYAADAAVKTLRDHGIVSALVAAGGDLVAAEPPPDSDHWRIAVAALAPLERSEPKLRLSRAAVSTSGDAEQFVEIGGQRYSHIIDPFTGLGLTNGVQATVVAGDGTTSDALATALCVLGPERGLPIIERLPGAAGRCVWKKNDALVERRSPRFPALTP
jgi:thiamine biosynthesis lipoprotein